MKNKTLPEQGIDLVNILHSIFISKYNLKSYMSKEDLEDMKQDAMIEMLERIDKFDASKGYVLSTFLSPRINGFFLDHLRKQGRLRRAETKHVLDLINLETDRVLSLDIKHATEKLDSLKIPSENIEELLFGISDDKNYEIFDSLQTLSNTRIYILLGYYIMDKSIKEITHELGYTYSGGWVHRMKREALAHLRITLIEKGILPKEFL